MDYAAKVMQARAQRLREEGHTVCEYTFDTAERKATASYATTLARDILLARQKLGADVPDDRAATELRRGSAIFDAFSRTHPRVFAGMCSMSDGPRHFEVLKELCAVRKQVDAGLASEQGAEAHVGSLVMSACSRPAEQQG